MNRQEEEQRAFDMAKQDIPFLKNLELVEHNDRPDFILKDKYGQKIGLEHFRADVYRVQDENSSHISGGHTVLNKPKDGIYQKYHNVAIDDAWTDELIKNASNELFEGFIKDSLNMRSNYIYESFLDNLHVSIHGKPPKVKGHIKKSQKYPDRESYDLMGFLIEIPVPSFKYYFETIESRRISLIKTPLCPLNLQDFNKIPRNYNMAYSYQKINGLPITNEIWRELNIFEKVDFIIIETYEENCLSKHYGQYFDKHTPKPHIYPAFSFGGTNIDLMNIQSEYKNDKINATFTFQRKQNKCGIAITKTGLREERRKECRKTRKHFDRMTKT